MKPTKMKIDKYLQCSCSGNRSFFFFWGGEQKCSSFRSKVSHHRHRNGICARIEYEFQTSLSLLLSSQHGMDGWEENSQYLTVWFTTDIDENKCLQQLDQFYSFSSAFLSPIHFPMIFFGWCAAMASPT